MSGWESHLSEHYPRTVMLTRTTRPMANKTCAKREHTDNTQLLCVFRGRTAEYGAQALEVICSQSNKPFFVQLRRGGRCR
jgi:hypothetical protein